MAEPWHEMYWYGGCAWCHQSRTCIHNCQGTWSAALQGGCDSRHCFHVTASHSRQHRHLRHRRRCGGPPLCSQISSSIQQLHSVTKKYAPNMPFNDLLLGQWHICFNDEDLGLCLNDKGHSMVLALDSEALSLALALISSAAPILQDNQRWYSTWICFWCYKTGKHIIWHGPAAMAAFYVAWLSLLSLVLDRSCTTCGWTIYITVVIMQRGLVLNQFNLGWSKI